MVGERKKMLPSKHLSLVGLEDLDVLNAFGNS